MLGVVDVLQAVIAEIPKGGAGRQAVLDERPGGTGEDDLPAVSRPGDPRGSVHVDADIVVPARNPLAGMEAHPDSRRGVEGPLVRGQGPLGGHGRPNGAHRAGKRDEEGVPLGPDLDPVFLGDGSANDCGAVVVDGRIPITELLEQPR